MAGNQDFVFETLESPGEIIIGSKDELIAIKHDTMISISEKHVVVIYREQEYDGFIITAFMTSKPEKLIKKGLY